MSRRWSNGEVESLDMQKQEGRTTAEIAQNLGRTTGSIRSKWTSLNKRQKIVIFLPHYDEKARMEVEFAKKPTKEQIQKALNDFRDKYGKFTKGVKKGLFKRKWRKLPVAWNYESPFKVKGFTDSLGRKNDGYRKSYRDWEDFEERRALLMHNQGKAYGRIAKELGRSYSSIKNRLQRLLGIRK